METLILTQQQQSNKKMLQTFFNDKCKELNIDCKLKWNDKHIKRFGRCYPIFRGMRHNGFDIEITTIYAVTNPSDGKETIKHELAHFLAGEGQCHNEVWKAKCKITGSNGQRLGDVIIPDDNLIVQSKSNPDKYKLRCPECGYVHSYYKSIVNKNISCGRCSPKVYNDKYKFVLVDMRNNPVEVKMKYKTECPECHEINEYLKKPVSCSCSKCSGKIYNEKYKLIITKL